MVNAPKGFHVAQKPVALTLRCWGVSTPWHVSVHAEGTYGTGLQYNAELVRVGGYDSLQFTELPLHPDPVHLQLPFPVHDEAAVYSELLDREERMGPLFEREWL